MTTNSPARPRAAPVAPCPRPAVRRSSPSAGALLALVSLWGGSAGCVNARSEGEPLAESRALISLNAAEERALCEAQNDLVARDPDFLEASCAAKSALLAGGNASRCEAERARCLMELRPVCDERSPPPYRRIAEAVDCPELTVGMLLMCNRANGPRAKVGYAEITCASDADEVDARLERLLDQQIADPADGCEPTQDVCPALRMSL